jgi:hypothetical protein
VHVITPLRVHAYTLALSKKTMASYPTIQGYSHFQDYATLYLSRLKLSAFDAPVRSCMHMSETLLCKHVSAEEQMIVRLSIPSVSL